MPRALAVARAGAVLGARPRILASRVEETVIAAVPTNPATSPLPIAAALAFAWLRMLGPPRPRGLAACRWRRLRPRSGRRPRAGGAGGRRPAARSPSP